MAETRTHSDTTAPNDMSDLPMQDVAVVSPGTTPGPVAPTTASSHRSDDLQDPEGHVAQEIQQAEGDAAGLAPSEIPPPGVGIEGEFTVWEGRYSLKNFMGRLVVRLLATAAWLVLAYFTWGRGDVSQPLQVLAICAVVLVVLYWAALGWQVFRARFSHFYRLTNKRLFVWSGIFNRRLDQLELVKVQDVYTREPTLWHRWFHVGTVVVESSEDKFPVTYLTGVNDPVAVMDTVWHTSRAERDGHTVRVDQV